MDLWLGFDNNSRWCYNNPMLKTQRKRRSDRNYLIYVITNQVTREQYLGLTVKNPGGVKKTLNRRIQKHVQRAMTENKMWTLCRSIREHGSDKFTYGFVEQVRGRKQAYVRERELIREYNPVLNTF
jgi:hypothetical protein